MTSEVWREVPGFPDYQVSDLGRVWFKRLGRILKQEADCRKGRPECLRVVLRKDRASIKVSVHRLVLGAFVGPCPLGMEGCHYDGNATNNRLSNLRWDTRASNQHDTMRHGRFHPPPAGTHLRGSAHPNAAITEADVKAIRAAPMKHGIGRVLARMYGVSESLVSLIRRGKGWAHI